MMPYIINVGLILTGCLAFYKIFLRKETFYRLNRSVLLICLLIAFLLPLVPVPKGWSFRKTSSQQTSIKASEQSRIPLALQMPVKGGVLNKKSDEWISPPEATSPLSRQATISAFE